MPLFRSRGFVVAALLYAVISLVCTQVPLLNYLGYEFSALIGLIGSLISGLITILMVKPVYYSNGTEGETRSSTVIAAFKQAIALNSVAVVVPLVIVLVNALFVKNCSLFQGLGFFFLVSVVSVWFGSVLGFLCAVHYRFSKIMFSLYCLSLLLYSIAEGYFTPAIFSYNFLYGYFPGITYDESLRLSWTLVLFRLLTILVGATAVWMAVLLVKHNTATDSAWTKGTSLLKLLADRQHRLGTSIAVAAIALTWFFRGELGFESTSGFIQSRLGSSYSTEHFTIYFSSSSYNADEIKWVGAEHEFRLKQIADAFFIQFHGKIESFIYPSSDSKQRFIGTGTTNIAKPWSGQLHVTKQSLDATLKHEIIHIVAGQFGLPIINASLSTGLVEGLAMAIEWNWGNRTPHEYAAAMKKFGLLPDIQPLLLLTGFASQASSVSYVLCGSFCRFLIDRYGMRKMMQVYRTDDFNLTYGRSVSELVDEWKGFLLRIRVKDQDREAVDVLFRRPPIFRKVCARVIAARNIQARKKYDDKDYKTAESLYGESYAEGNDYEALGGYLASALRSGNAALVVATYDSVITKNPSPFQYLPLFMTIGDAFWTLGETKKAQELYLRVKQANLSATLSELATLRLMATNDPSGGRAILECLMPDVDESRRLAILDSILGEQPTSWMPKYLKARFQLSKRGFNESLSVLNSIMLGSVDSLLEARRLRMVGFDLFHLARFQDARVTFWNSLNYVSTEVAVNEVNDWVERCEWMEKNNPL